MPPRFVRLAAAGFLVLLGAAGVRGSSQQGTVSGGVTGRVVTATKGEAVEGALVTVNIGAQTLRAVTDSAGRFTFADLKPGSWSIAATKPGYLTTGLDQPASFVPPRPLVVRGGRPENVTIRLWPQSTLSGLLLGSAGSVAKRTLQLFKGAVIGGQFRWSPDASAQSDAGGGFKFSVKPGRYLLTLSGNGDGRTSGVLTFFPAGFSVSNAQILEVAPGQEVTGLAFRIPEPSTAMIRGVVAGSVDPRLRVELRGAGPGADSIDIPLATTSADGEGRFEFGRLPFGHFVIRTRTAPTPMEGTTAFQSGDGSLLTKPASPNRMIHSQSAATGAVFWGQTECDSALEPLICSVPLVQAAQFRGTVVFMDRSLSASASAELAGKMTVQVVSASGLNLGLLPAARVDASLTFRTAGFPPGKYLIRALCPAPWRIVSLAADGVEAFDRPITLGAADIQAVLQLTTKAPSQLRGLVLARDGRPATDAFVYVFPVSAHLWTETGTMPLRIRQVRADSTGSFSLRGMPRGEYYVAAEPAPNEYWALPEYLTRLMATASKVEVREAEVYSVTVRLR